MEQLDYKEAALKLSQELEALGVTMEAVRIPQRPDHSEGDTTWNKEACHAMCTIAFKNKHTITTPYSAGSMAALSHIKSASEALTVFRNAPYSKRPTFAYHSNVARAWENRQYTRNIMEIAILETLRSTWMPTLSDVVAGLLMDATDTTFEDFCEEFGMETDSRKAHSVWETCCDTRRQLIKGLGSAKFEELRELAYML